MTRINLIPPSELTDQHLMAEYRELPMVMGSAKRSHPSTFVPAVKYLLNKGHVKFFFNKRAFLLDRYQKLILELRKRGFNIDPGSREVDWSVLDKFPQVEWKPKSYDIEISRERITWKISLKPWWYTINKVPIATINNKIQKL